MSRKALEALAVRWVPGGGPVQVQPMARGLVNESFRIERAGRRYVMRVATDTSPDLGQDRDWECKVLACAAGAGLAPRIECCEVCDGVLISDWVECRAWATEETELPTSVRAMAQLLPRVHALPIPQPARAMNPAAWIRHYAAALARHEPEISRRSQALRGSAERHLAELAAAGPTRAVLCHSDLHRFNVAIGIGPTRSCYCSIGSTRMWRILTGIWPVGPPIMTGPARRPPAGLGSYLGRPALQEETGRLSLWMWLYDYVCVLWSELYLKRAPDEATRGVEARWKLFARAW